MKIVAWGKTDTGRKRDHNEDNFLVDIDLHLFAVADGMGGHQGGETASRMALEVLKRHIANAGGVFEDETVQASMGKRETQPMAAIDIDSLGGVDEDATDAAEDSTGPPEYAIAAPAASLMRAAARQAGHEIFDAALEDSELRGMGTTLTAMLFANERMHIVHAGDSRAFLFRENRLEQLTDDHSWIWEQVKSGAMTEEEAKESKFRHIITRSVGFERDVDVDTHAITVQAGDCFLLCSDGMSNYIENDELELILGTNWYRRAPQLLVDLANDRGGDDNITVVVVYISNDNSEY